MTNQTNTKDYLKALSPLEKALKDCKGAFTVMFLVTFMVNLLSIAPILYMMNMFDRVLPTNSKVTLVSLLGLVLVLYLFWSALEWFRSRLMIRISLRVDWDLAATVFDACFRQSLKQPGMNAQQSMNDMLTIRQFATGQSIIALLDVPFALIFVAVAFLVHPYLAGFIIVATVLLGGLTFATKKVTTGPIQAANQNNMEANRVISNSLQGAESAMVMGMLPSLRKRWHERHRLFLQHQVNSSEASGMMGMISGMLNKALPSLQITVAVLLAGLGLISAGGVIAASFLMGKSISPLKTLVSRWEEVVKARMAWQRLDDLLKQEEEITERMALPAPKGHLLADEMDVAAPNSSRPILRNLNFEVLPGEVLAIVGPNATGKTSLLKVMLGIWKPANGFMRLDGAEVHEWRHEDLGDKIGYVPQKINMFEATVAENIARLGDVDSEAVVKAAEMAGMHQMILAFPKGYDTMLGDGQFELSGGQAQRLALARALYKMPTLVILDEPNSNLDDQSEIQLQRAIRELKAAGSTVVMTSHRTRLVTVSDKMLVINDGQQTCFGPTKEILPRLIKQPTPSAPKPIQGSGTIGDAA